MLKYRLVSAFLLMPIVIGVLFFLPLFWFAIVTFIVCMLSAWEWGRLSFLISSQAQWIWLFLVFNCLLTIVCFTLLNQSYHDLVNPLLICALWMSLGWWFFALFLVLFYPDSAVMWRNSKTLLLIFGLFIIVPFFLGMLGLRAWHYDNNYYSGAICLFYIMILVWGFDSGAYMFGNLFGKEKLAPKVSQNKTWQGFIGGLFMAAIISLGSSIWINLGISLTTFLLCSFFTVLAAVLGDLTESMFKREAGIKDSSSLIPGHGGMLDRMDSLMAAVPVFAYLLLVAFG